MGTVGASAEPLSDEVLLAGLGAGDAALALAFVRRFQRIVYGVALAVTGDPVTGEDVAQQAFEQAWRHASVYDSRRGTVRAWLTTITHNLAVDVVRARSALPMDPDDLPAVIGAMSESPERLAVANDSAREVRHALGRLPAGQARAVAMSGIYGMTAQQVADTEGIPLGTAKTRIRDGMRKLRTAFLPDGTGRPPGTGRTIETGLADEPGLAGETGLQEETGDE
jgi:RNA polymerase sigma-70 factor (ECF subfamily)